MKIVIGKDEYYYCKKYNWYCKVCEDCKCQFNKSCLIPQYSDAIEEAEFKNEDIENEKE